jgi:hypothetical protein
VSHRVVQRVAQDGQYADGGGGRHLEPEQRIDAEGDDEVVGECDKTRNGHLPFEVDRHEDRDEDQEDDQALQGLLADVSAPCGPHYLDLDVVGRHAARGPERLGQLIACFRVHGLGLDPQRAVAELGDHGLTTDHRLCGFLGLFDRTGCPGHLELRAALELDAQVEAAEDQRPERDCEDHPGDRVPELAAIDEVVTDLTGVQAVREVAER